MEERMIQFITGLRAAGVRISLAESADAFRAVEQMGVRDRDTFRISLRTTMVKDARDIPAFEELFPLFFDTSAAPPLMDLTQDLSPEEAGLLAQALQQVNQRLRRMLERLAQGQQLTPPELERLGQLVGLNQATDMRYRDWLSQRMQRAMGFREVREAIQELAQLLDELGMNRQRVEQLRQILQANQQAIGEQLDQFAGQRIAENMSRQPQDGDSENLLRRPFNALSDRDMDRLRKEVQRLAAALRTRVALRQKRARTGILDAKATIRANLKHANVPIQIKHRDRTLKPKLIAICDISTSMRPCSELMLSLLYAIQDQISKTHAFAFIDHLEYISPDFEGRPVKEAVQSVLDRMPSGYYNTDLGHSLKNFSRNYLDLIDSRTTFIIVGDGRNNYNHPRLDLVKEIARRSRRIIWLNPEPPTLWGSGDSDMLKYLPYCETVLQASNLEELFLAVDKLLV